MAETSGNNVRVVKLFMGTRADLAPHPLAYIWLCECCKAETYSEASPPSEQRLVCNVCAAQLSAMAEQASKTRVGWGMTDEGWDIIDDIAEEKQRPVEEVFKHALEWQLRRPIKGEIYRKPVQKVKKG
jgi:hypothetical protein